MIGRILLGLAILAHLSFSTWVEIEQHNDGPHSAALESIKRLLP